jgi:hypothetical protein
MSQYSKVVRAGEESKKAADRSAGVANCEDMVCGHRCVWDSLRAIDTQQPPLVSRNGGREDKAEAEVQRRNLGDAPDCPHEATINWRGGQDEPQRVTAKSLTSMKEN